MYGLICQDSAAEDGACFLFVAGDDVSEIYDGLEDADDQERRLLETGSCAGDGAITGAVSSFGFPIACAAACGPFAPICIALCAGGAIVAVTGGGAIAGALSCEEE